MRLATYALATALLLSLSGCGDTSMQGLKQWMDETKKQVRPSVLKLPAPKKFTPYVYSSKESIDPYNPSKLAVALAKLQSQSNNTFKPDFDRRKEPLEAYPLDVLHMVGTIHKAGVSYALLQADKVLFQVKAGNYIGQNFGLITKITDTEVELKEIIQDASGEWVERQSKLELQETKK